MSKKSSLYIIQNIFIFMEECFVEEPQDADYYTFNPLYVKDQQAQEQLTGFVDRLYPDMLYADFEKALEEEWNKVYISSYFGDLPLLSKLSCDEMILVCPGCGKMERIFRLWCGPDYILILPSS